MQLQWKNFAFWTGAILIIVLATIFYQPAAAKTGSLLVWTRDRVYVMDIDTLHLERIGPANADEVITPSPGCAGLVDTPCWVVVSDRLYEFEPTIGPGSLVQRRLPIAEGFRWDNEIQVSWSPDGAHLAYSVVNRQDNSAELRVYDAASGQVKLKAANIDPSVAPAWTQACEAGLNAVGCELGYKQMPNRAETEFLPSLIGFKPASGEVRSWTVSPEPIYELLWTPDNELLYSRPKRFFRTSVDHAPAYYLPPGSQLANMSPDGRYTLYYQPFKLKDCPTENEEDECLNLGVWLTPTDNPDENRSLIYSVDLSAQKEGLNFIPTWSAKGDAFVFFQEGRLVHYDLVEEEALIWYKAIKGRLRSLPVFSPNEEAVAFVDNQGQGYSEYRLVIVNPKLQPIEHIIETETGFRILAWLPN